MKKIIVPILMAMASLSWQACAPQLPQTRKDDTVDEYFGVKVADPYRWLEDDNSDETAAWVKAQNRVTEHYLKHLPARAGLKTRLRELCDYERVGLPSRENNGKWYWFRNNGLQNQSVFYEADAPDGEPRVLLDPNTLSEDGTVALKGIYFSRDCRYMAYSISRSGSDWQEFYVMETESRKLLDDHILWAKFSGAAWRGDGFYYSAYDAPEGDGHEYSVKNEGHKIYYHRIGTPQSEDELFFSNPAEPQRFYTMETNEEETFAYLYEDGADIGNNLYVRDFRDDKGFILMTSDMKHRSGVIENDGNTLYIFTNDGAPMNRLMCADVRQPQSQFWKPLIAESDCVLEGVTFVADKIIASYSKDATTHAWLCDLQGRRLQEIALPGAGTAGFTGKKGESWCYYAFSSFTVPGTQYRFDPQTGESSLFRTPEVAFDANAFETVQVFYPSKDGTLIPMFLTYKKGREKNGSNPTLLYGYGGFDISLPPAFSFSIIPFLESGGIYAQANLRGGGEYGEAWHLAGTKMNKQNVFDDFIAAARWLIAEGWTSEKKLAIMSGSNGGLLVGACMTQAPELFAVAIPRVGVMDMLRYHKFTIGWNWASDYGTSEESQEMFDYLLGYSPLHNLRPGTVYPATLVTTADHDDRVVPAHSFKFAATLQECNAGPAPCLIRIDTKAGHGGGKPIEKVIEEQADIYAFIFKNLGM